MLKVNALSGFGIGNLPGPYTMTYRGRTDSSGYVSSLSGSYTLGPEYSDRLVFIGVMGATTGTNIVSDITVGGKSATKIGGDTTYGLTEWWFVASDTGVNSVSVVATLPVSDQCAFVVYTLGGGALGGISPTITVDSNFVNNNNFVSSNFASAAANDIFLAVAVKRNGGSNSITGFNSDMSPLIENGLRGLSNLATGSGSCSVGPVTTAQNNVFVQAQGNDSSKPIQITTIRISKKI